MKRFLLYVAIMLGSLIAQAQPAVECHDATAAIGDSVRIVPQFKVGDTRTYLVTVTNSFDDQFVESHSAVYRFTVESVDQDHYGIYFFLEKMQYEMPDNIPTTQAKMLLDMFQDKGFRFSINRNDLTVDSIFYTEFLDPFKVYLTTAFRQMFADKMEPEQLEREIEEGLNGDFLKSTVNELMQTMITPFTELYGRTLPLGEGQWIEDMIDEESIDDMELPDVQEDEEADDTEVVNYATDELDSDEELPDVSLQKIHYTTTTRGEDGSIQYTETVIWDINEPVLQERYEVTLDANGWPIEITHHFVMMGYTEDVHWQLIEENK